MKFFQKHNRHFRTRILILASLALLGLSFVTSWYHNSILSVEYQQKSLQRYILEQQKDARQVLNDTAMMRRVVQHRESSEDFYRLTNKPYGLFLFAETLSDNQDLLFWNSQKILHPQVSFEAEYGTSVQKLLNGYYVVQKQKLVLPGMSNNVIAYAVIPVLRKYYLETEDSRTTFAHNEYAVRRIGISEGKTGFPIHSLGGKTLFYVQQVDADTPASTDPVSLVFRLTAIVLLLIALHLYAESIVRRKGAISGILFLASVLLLVRAVLYFLPNFVALRQVELFDPAIYGANRVNDSLGALLINAIFLCWIILFAWNRLGPLKELPFFLKEKRIIAAGVAGIFLLILATFQLADIVYQLVVSSKISFEVTDFPKLSRYTAISFLILALLSLSYYYFSRHLFRFVLLAFPRLLHLYFMVAVIGLLFLTFRGNYTEVLFYLPVLCWLVLYTLLLTQEQSIINRFRISIAGLLFWIFIFSVSLALLIMEGNREREKLTQKNIALKLDEQTDPNKINALFIVMRYIDNRFLRDNFSRFSRAQESGMIRDSITNSSMPDYNAAYNTSIYLFNRDNIAINNPDRTTYDELNNIYTAYKKRMGNSQNDIAYYESSPTRFVYLIRRQVFDSTQMLGTLFLVATPKQFQEKEAFYPRIFTQGDDRLDLHSVTNAIYLKGNLVQYNGNYPFTETLKSSQIPANEFTFLENNDYTELWYKASNIKTIVVAQKKDTLVESITLFSYLFCAFLFMVGVIRLFELLARVAGTWPRVDIFSRLSIRSQIHATIIFISVLSFFIIGVVTITYFVQRNKRESIETLHHAATNTLTEIEKQVAEEGLSFTGDSFSDSATARELVKLVTDISDVHGLIVNIYDTSGVLKITSAPNIYQRGVLSTKMDPVAYYHFKTIGDVQRVQDESVADLNYQSIYKMIRDSTQQTFAFLNIPYFHSERKLDQEISYFLVTIINLNAFIVLIAGVIALFITNRITRSFSVIGDKMKQITLGRTDEEIEWTKNDEIGELVKQYNRMVQQLEESASALAKSEREGAWREMARQVAHEIKNPLTPMKLSIQYLQRAIQTNQPNVKDLTTSVAGTLIEQIDHLSKIAADFSQFANIGNKRLEEIDLHHVINSLLDLYAANPKVEVTWNPVLIEAIMRVDKTHMNRLFTNLLTNAVDACSEREKCLVVITEKLAGKNLLISITDNGDGIPKEMQSKIFTPNFTTKTSGTGLGLAMCKGIVEQAGGDIWFQTKEGEGTTFFVQLPLAVNGL